MTISTLLRFRGTWIAITLAAVCTATPRLVQAEMILIDDFNDGNDDGWTHMDSNEGKAWGPGIYDASSGEYHLGTTGTVPGRQVDRERGFMLSIWDESSDPFYSEGFVRTKFRSDTFHGHSVILFRYSGDIASGLNGYVFGGSSGIGFNFNRITNTKSTLSRVLGGGLIPAVGEEWWMEAGGLGSELSMKVWRVGEPEPASPQLRFSDSTYTTGVFGFDANMNWGTDVTGVVNSYFDDVYFTPSAVPGDFDDDRKVDGNDLLIWQRDPAVGTLAEWQANYGAASSLASYQAVPEPTGILSIATFVISLAYGHRFASKPARYSIVDARI